MKTLFLFLFYSIPLFGLTQVIDNFSDGNFTINPVWTGDTSLFEVNSTLQLHLRSTGADTSVLMTQNTRINNTEWDFWVKLSFNTSANNHARIYLASDMPDLTGSLNGYFLQIGGSNDSVTFYKQTGNTLLQLFGGSKTATANSTNILRVKMIHDSTGTWHLLIDGSGNSDFIEEGACKETSITQTSWFGVYCRYTTSNSTKFYFDDIYIGPVIVDTVSPVIINTEVISDHDLRLFFSESIERTSGEIPENYFVAGHGHPSNIKADSLDPGVYNLHFDFPFENATCDTLFVSNIKDLSGNISKEQRSFFCIYEERAFDIVISEIMADPDPQVGLPDAEYVELFNRSPFPIRLRDWIFEAGSTRKTLPDVTIASGGYLTLTKGDWLGFFGSSVNLFTSSSTLTNDGTTLVLRNDFNKIIHSVNYTMDWYNNSLKENGGWSLEMIDPGNPCGCAGNWSSAENPLGGTPGGMNSIFSLNPDTIKPYLTRALINDEQTIHLFFSESMDSSSFSGSEQWNGLINGLVVDSVKLVPPGFSELLLHFTEPFQRGFIYELYPPIIFTDCSENFIDTTISIRFAIPDTLVPFDVVINEILPNPYSDGERFIEIVNRSDKVLDLKNLVFADAFPDLETVEDPVNITDDGYLIFPGQYVVLTKAPGDIQARYQTPGADCFIKMSSFPEMTDDEGTLILARKYDLVEIDRMSYTKEMQFPMLSSSEGVSLERIDENGPSGRNDNWHSAAETYGFATPGYKNSQAGSPGPANSFVVLTPELFTPDNDGKDDLLFIQFQLDKPGYIVNVAIYDSRGRLIRQLIRSTYVSPEGFFSWDGLTEERMKAPVGIYLVWVELFSPDGTVKKFKNAAVLGGKF